MKIVLYLCSKQYSTKLFLAIGKPLLNFVNSFNCKDADVIKNTELGNCAQFIFAYESLHGNVTYKDLYYNPSATAVDGWRGEWIKINFNHQRYLLCQIDGWIDGDNPWTHATFLSQDFVCTIP